MDRILEVIGALWAQSTKQTYGAELLVFHIYCNLHNIPEVQRCPVLPTLLLSFLSSCAGSYAGSTLSNYAVGLRAWHLLHGHSWNINNIELKAMLKGATQLAPPSSKCPCRQPITPAHIILIRAKLNLDAAIYACPTTVFYAVARLGESTVPTIKDFNPNKHITQANISDVRDRNNLRVKTFSHSLDKIFAH
ncbi:hypothetical protein SERLA73DRAFT_67202 [Serpula lacrymans var. lacrymans S7.3]|uniref:Uncharacterized protein n=1 Tax=Serpula lacrymans var. lacrymans (strain S7.3) TaxID=936435 RepID=F8QJG4_SERL3|nr:hypothetical protein SERLA73DRAFT_67202 [Serpula lacrymans var. lacrymans S7.3]